MDEEEAPVFLLVLTCFHSRLEGVMNQPEVLQFSIEGPIVQHEAPRLGGWVSKHRGE